MEQDVVVDVRVAGIRELRQRLRRMLLLWGLYGLPRCSGISDDSDHCWRLIWPWQERELRNGAPVHLACLVSA